MLGVQFACFANANFIQPSVPAHDIEIQESGLVVGTSLIQQEDTRYTFTGDVNGSIAIFCDNIIVDGAGYALLGNENSTGLFLQGRCNVTIMNLQICNFKTGILFVEDFFKTVRNNYGFYIERNIIENNDCGIESHLFTELNISENIFRNNKIAINCLHSSIDIKMNELEFNDEALVLIDSKGNVHQNSFINNAVQARLTTDSLFPWPDSIITWNDNNSSAGNYWSDYTGEDINADGTGDTPYFIDENNQDFYPLISPIALPVITSHTVSPFLLGFITIVTATIVFLLLSIFTFRKIRTAKNAKLKPMCSVPH
jgi:hypothetical protein